MIFLKDLEKTSSTPKVNTDKISVATETTIVEDCSSGHFGHSTFSLNSVIDPFIKFAKLIVLLFARAQGLEP